MSTTDTQEMMEMATKPLPEHKWLEKLAGSWKSETEMFMPDGSKNTATGKETVKVIGGLWAVGEGTSTMPDGSVMEYLNGLGYDVSFKEYRGFWLASMSSHLWKYTCELSSDGKTMTMNCEGPHMEKDGETANYRDVIELVDDNTRTLKSYGQDDKGEWQQFMTVRLTRV